MIRLACGSRNKSRNAAGSGVCSDVFGDLRSLKAVRNFLDVRPSEYDRLDDVLCTLMQHFAVPILCSYERNYLIILEP